MKINVERRTNSDRQKFFNGTIREEFNALVTATTGPDVVTLSLEKNGGGDLTLQFSDGLTLFDTTPAATIALTAGSDASPTENFIFISQSTKALTKATDDWPTTEHTKIGYYLVPSAGFVENNGVYINQNWNDDLSGSDGMGDSPHIGEKLRRLTASYFSGIDGNGTQGYLTPTNLDTRLKSTAGVIYQKHRHTFSAVNTDTDVVLVRNWSGDPFHDITNLFDITADSTGAAIGNNKYFNLVIWGAGNKEGEYSPLLINLPGGFYNTQSAAEEDVSGHDDFSMPREFNRESSTGFLIARITIQMKTAGTWIVSSTTDLRGQTPNTASGGVGSITQEFADNAFKIFDETDITKEAMFDVGTNVDTGTTRTLQIPNANGIIALTAQTDGTINASDITAGTFGTGVYVFDDVVTIQGLGTGGLTDYDLKVGDTDGTPTYGMIQIGNASIGRTSYKVGNIDLDGALIYRNISGPVTGEIEHVFVESTGDTTRFALAKAGVGNATYNSRSMLIAGPAPADTDYVKVSYWQANNNIFDNLVCDTAGSGADLGVQNDLEVEGDIFTDSIKESTTAAGITFGNSIDVTGAIVASTTITGEQITSTDDITMQGHLFTMGDAGAATDSVMSFLGSTNSGTITYDESADEFDFGDAAITTTGTATAEKFIGWGVAPIGSVMAWIKSFTGTPALPDGWLEANGQALTGGAAEPDSPYNGETLPNLNGASAGTKRFLRGNTTSGTTGGSFAHVHSIGVTAIVCGCCVQVPQCLTSGIFVSKQAHTHCHSGANTSGCCELPDFYEVVWIIRIK